MKLSEVVCKLDAYQRKYGDLEVCHWDSYWDKIRRCNDIEVMTRDIKEFPERAAWTEERVIVLDFDGGSIDDRGGTN